MGEADEYYNDSQGNGASSGQYGRRGKEEEQYYPPPPPPPVNFGSNRRPAPPPPVQQQQQYQPAQNGGGVPNGDGYGAAIDEKYDFDQKFKIQKPKWNDLWAGILLIAVFFGFVVISGITLYGYSHTRNVNGGGIYDGSNTFSLDTNTMILFVFVLVVAVVLSYGYVWLARLFPRQFIWITGILNICWAIGTAVFYFWRHYWSAAIVFLIFALFLAFCFYTWIKRIPFSALMLRTSIDISKKYGHVYLVSFIGGMIATALGAWFSVTLVAIYVKYEPSPNNPACDLAGGSCSQAKVIGLVVYVTFAMYWISEWLKNTIHTTISGVYGSWYFYPHNFPKGATRGAARRALTYSFGSISLGSLLVAIVQFLRQLCSVAQTEARAQGGAAGMIGYAIFCVMGCFISILDWAIQFLNRYAFSHIALYGKSYFAAAKDTWNMIKDRGFDALINECLIGPVLSFGALFVGYACALLAYLYLWFTNPAYNNNGQFTAVIMAFSFLIGFQIANVFTTPLSSGIDTIFVAMAWDPQVMARDHPELYSEMVKVYPRAQQMVQVR